MEIDERLDPTIGEHFALLRRRSGLSQYDLAKAAGVSRNTIVNLENDKAFNIQLLTLTKIAKGLGYELTISLVPSVRTDGT